MWPRDAFEGEEEGEGAWEGVLEERWRERRWWAKGGDEKCGNVQWVCMVCIYLQRESTRKDKEPNEPKSKIAKGKGDGRFAGGCF